MRFDWKAKLGILLFMIILITGVYIITNFNHILDNTVKITYPDGCVEIYFNGNLNNTECTMGRAMLNQSYDERVIDYDYGNIGIGQDS